jgi:hypothetical protein
MKAGDNVRYIKYIDVSAKIYPKLNEICETTTVSSQAVTIKGYNGWCYKKESFEVINKIDWFSLNRSVT